MNDEAFDVIDLMGIEVEKMEHLNANPETKCLILLQWIQRMIIKGLSTGVITVAPPIVSRIFQQLGNGYTSLIDAQKIADVPFPFPYAQMVSLLLVTASFVTPVICGMNMESKWWAAGLTFMCIFGFWAINYIAAEIEMPFGDDKNDLPVAELQKELNRDLRILLDKATQIPPMFDFSRERHSRVTSMKCDEGLLERVVRSSSFGMSVLDLPSEAPDNKPPKASNNKESGFIGDIAKKTTSLSQGQAQGMQGKLIVPVAVAGAVDMGLELPPEEAVPQVPLLLTTPAVDEALPAASSTESRSQNNGAPDINGSSLTPKGGDARPSARSQPGKDAQPAVAFRGTQPSDQTSFVTVHC